MKDVLVYQVIVGKRKSEKIAALVYAAFGTKVFAQLQGEQNQTYGLYVREDELASREQLDRIELFVWGAVKALRA